MLKLISMFIAFISMSWMPIGKYLADNLKSEWYVSKLDTIDYKTLPQPVKDTLKYVSTEYRKAYYRGDTNTNMSVIDFSHEYRLEPVKSGPWSVRNDYKNIKTGRRFSLDYDMPSPIIIYDKDIYIPVEHNIIPFDSVPETMFHHYKLRYR